ncbi:H-NS histone family protein [Trinickia terrae]|uniref:H-NS histone family protein n=1 Tax=Trinickia terrae TaxID=2571161 RepID=A0A4U1HH65_9BURK|nr:H-NS histone family protein [Trinickia terrae]TKC80405.1 H-NS histone family protein [Trinickia terrae]
MNYRDLQAELKRLDQEIERAKDAEYESTLAKVRETVAAFGFTSAEIFGRSNKKFISSIALYRHPETGATWGGRGPRPKWLKGKDLALFVIKK